MLVGIAGTRGRTRIHRPPGYFSPGSPIVLRSAYSGAVATAGRENAMVLCPVALAVGCKGCPVFNVCPLKGVIGDYKPDEAAAKSKDGGSASKK